MIKKLLACWALLFFLMAAAPPAVEDPYGLAPLRQAIPAEVMTVWMDCGEANAAYLPAVDTILMCNELRNYSRGVVATIYAHELAHAFIHQFDVPFTGSEEWAADELAAVTLIKLGRPDDIMEAGKWLLENPNENPLDVHMGGLRRAGYLYCMVEQSKGNKEDWCYVDYNRIAKVWKKWLDGARL